MKKQYLEISKKFSAILTKNEAEFLLNITKSILKQGVIVEIGTYKGGSAFLLAKGSIKNKKGKVYTIDPDIHNLKSLTENIKKAKMENWIIPITKTSEQAIKNWKKPISLLWIDGNHDYPFVKIDFLLWEKYLIKGGIIAFHDSRYFKGNILFDKGRHIKQMVQNGPQKVVRENILNSNRSLNINFVNSITYARKIRYPEVLELLRNIYNLYLCKLIILPKKFYQKIGKFGIFLKNHSPRLYFKLKKLKDGI